MFLNPYFQDHEGASLISSQQASDFAKNIAADFNPIHNPDHRRFCVPGDLLFALTLVKYGLRQNMTFTFEGMVGHNVKLQFPAEISEDFSLADDQGKVYLNVKSTGNVLRVPDAIEAFIRSYVAFSGHNFMDVLVPLMTQNQMMINTSRPLVVYESMAFDLQHFDFQEPTLKLTDSNMAIKGKRGDVKLYFDILCQNQIVGTGYKTLILSGLRPFDQDKLNALISEYDAVTSVA